MYKKQDYKVDDKSELSDLDIIKGYYQRKEDITGKVYGSRKDKYIHINKDFYMFFLFGCETMMEQDNFIQIKKKTENYDGFNNTVKKKNFLMKLYQKQKNWKLRQRKLMNILINFLKIY